MVFECAPLLDIGDCADRSVFSELSILVQKPWFRMFSDVNCQEAEGSYTWRGKWKILSMENRKGKKFRDAGYTIRDIKARVFFLHEDGQKTTR